MKSLLLLVLVVFLGSVSMAEQLEISLGQEPLKIPQCYDSRDCFQNEHCVNGSCAPKSDRCSSSIDCSFPEKCVEGSCVRVN